MSDISPSYRNDTSPSDTRFSPITDHDKAGILWIAALMSGIYAVLSMVVRSYIKRTCFGYDDWICLAATVSSPLLELCMHFPVHASTTHCIH